VSRHWNSRSFAGGRSARRRRGRGKPIFSTGELRLTILAGLLLGLIYVQASGGGIGAGEAPAEIDFHSHPIPDPYGEARRSREILREQEGAPAPISNPEKRHVAAERVGRGDLVDVVDGDTFRYRGDTIRIADIDTPEVNGRCAEETALAARATDRLATLLAAGPFTLEPMDRDEDKYGRKLRIVTRGGQSIGDALVAEGLARRWDGQRRPWCN